MPREIKGLESIEALTVLTVLHPNENHSRISVNRSFCQICQNYIRSENIQPKNLPLTGFEPSTPGLSVVLTSYSLVLPTVLDPIA